MLQSSVQAIVQDHQGFLWFATQDGLDIDNADLTELLFAIQISSSDDQNNYHEDSLGLKAMKKMIEENDGRIELISENGKYCELKFTITV